MPINIDIVEQEYRNSLRAAKDSADFTPNLVGNVGDEISVRLLISLGWDAKAQEDGLAWQYQGLSSTAAKVYRPGGSWVQDGFGVGDIGRFWEVFQSQPAFEVIVTAISVDEKTLFIELVTYYGSYTTMSFTREMQQAALVARADLFQNRHSAAIFRPNLIPNSAQFDAVSLQTGGVQAFYTNEINATTPVEFVPQGTDKSAVSSSGNTILIVLNAVTDVQYYEVVYNFILTPLFLFGQRENFEQEQAPVYLEGNNALKFAFEIEFRKALTNVNSAKKLSYDSNLGSTGWFNENYNGFNSPYELGSISYQDATTSEPVEGLQITGNTSVTVTIFKPNSFFDIGTAAGFGLFRLPNNSAEIQQTSTDLKTNFLYDQLIAIDGQGVTTGTGIISELSVNVTGGQIVLRADVAYTALEQLRLSSTDQFVIFATVEDFTLDVGSSDKTNLLCDLQTYVLAAGIPGLITWQPITFYQVNDTPGTDTPEADIATFNESGLLVDFAFDLDVSKQAVLRTLDFKLVAANSAGVFFELDKYSFDLTDTAVVAGVQQININDSRGYLLPTADPFNDATILTDARTGDLQRYTGRLGQKIKWQEWIRNNNVPAALFDANETQDNLNYKSSNYSGEQGYEIKLLAQSTLTGIDSRGVSGTGADNTFSTAIAVNDYNEPTGEVVAGSLTTLAVDTLVDAGGLLLQGQDMIFQATFTPTTAPSVAGAWVTLRLEETGNPADNIWEITTAKVTADSPLQPLSGESFVQVQVSGGDIIARCLVVADRLNADQNYNLSAELYFDPFANLAFALTFRCDTTATVTPTVTKIGAAATWLLGNTPYITNTPSIPVTSGNEITLIVDDLNSVTGLNLNTCRVGGVVDISTLPAMQNFAAKEANYPTFKFSATAIQQPIVQTHELENSIAKDNNFGSLLDAYIIANSGTAVDNGNDYTGDAGVTVAGRTINVNVGTLVNQLLITQQRINYQKWDALDDSIGVGKGFIITNVKALCRKSIDFYVTDNIAEADYEIVKDYTPLATSPIFATDFVEGVTSYTDIAFNNASFELLNANKVALSPAVTGLSAIDNYLLNNDCTGFYLRCKATALTGKLGIVTFSYFDLPDDTKACGHVDKAGWPKSDIWVDFADVSTITASGNLLQNVVDKSGNNWLFESTSTGPRVFGDFVRFDNQLNSLVYNGAKSDFNFLHDGTVDYAIVFAVDLSASTGNNKVNQIFGTEGNYASANVGLSLNNEQRINSTKGIRIAISTGVGGAFAYNLLGVNVVNGMAIYTFNVPINSAGTLEVFVNKILAGSSARLNPPTLNDSTVNATIGAVRRPGISALMDLADLVILKNPTAVQIAVWEEILAYKNGITL